ncbi:MAG: hypothetical protein AB1758_09395 [Candidatus Eremiobacterota bacterium]
MTRVVVVALLSLLAVVGCGSPPTPMAQPTGPGPADVPPPDLKERPFGRAEAFMDLVRTGRTREAHEFFTESASTRTTLFQFENELKAWSDESGLKQLKEFKVMSEVIRGDNAKVAVGDPSRPEVEPWILIWTRKEDRWMLSSAQGGPFGEPELHSEQMPSFR